MENHCLKGQLTRNEKSYNLFACFSKLLGEDILKNAGNQTVAGPDWLP